MALHDSVLSGDIDKVREAMCNGADASSQTFLYVNNQKLTSAIVVELCKLEHRGRLVITADVYRALCLFAVHVIPDILNIVPGAARNPFVDLNVLELHCANTDMDIDAVRRYFDAVSTHSLFSVADMRVRNIREHLFPMHHTKSAAARSGVKYL